MRTVKTDIRENEWVLRGERDSISVLSVRYKHCLQSCRDIFKQHNDVGVVLRVGGPLQEAQEVHLLKISRIGSEALAVVRKFENHQVNVPEQIAAPFTDSHDVARKQLVRFRHRLGKLTRDQELQIENLLISTVTKISLMTGRLMESLGESE